MNLERSKPTETRKKEVILLSGGNPQIPKGDGDAPVRAYIEAMPGWDPKGKEPASDKGREPMPEELVRRLAEDPALKAAFEALTPGRQRGYLLHISGARQSKTRAARVEKWRSRILEGKGMHDR